MEECSSHILMHMLSYLQKLKDEYLKLYIVQKPIVSSGI